MTNSHVCHDSVKCVTWLIHTCDIVSVSGPVTSNTLFPPAAVTSVCVMCDVVIRVTWLICMYDSDVTQLRVWHDSFTRAMSNSLFPPAAVTCVCVKFCLVTCVTWLVHVCDITQPLSSRCRDLYMCDKCLSHMYGMTRSCVSRQTSCSLPLPWPLYVWLSHMCDMTWLVCVHDVNDMTGLCAWRETDWPVSCLHCLYLGRCHLAPGAVVSVVNPRLAPGSLE
jgi:hypothetical protein